MQLCKRLSYITIYSFELGLRLGPGLGLGLRLGSQLHIGQD